MLRAFQSSLIRSFSQPRFFFSYELMKKSLSKDLFSIELINKVVNRRILSMAYSPGVGAVCEAIQQDPTVADTMTLRPRAVAILTDGSFLNASGEGVAPAMDWLIAQIKYYSGLDAFPFVVSKDINLQETLKDLATSYGTILYLDNRDLGEIPNDLLVVRQQEVVSLVHSQLTDAEKTSNVLAYLINKKVKGLPSLAQLSEGLHFNGDNFKNFKPYSHEVKDGRDIYTHALQLHAFYTGKIHVELGFHDINKIKPYFTEENLRKIAQEPHPYSKTSRLSAIVTDGTSILGYGNIGPRAGLPVMEGKSLLFKLLGDVEVVPVCMYPRATTKEAIQAIIKLLGNFDAVNLEDIKAPECFDIEEGLNALRVLPIFHDDQHGTAIVTLAGLINAAKVVDKDLKECKIIINGAGAAGITIAKLLLSYGVKDIIICDSVGSIYRGRTNNMNDAKRKIAEVTNLDNKIGLLPDVITGYDIFIGVSQEKALRGHWVSKMAQKSIVFALANPVPEIYPEDAKRSGAWIYGSGRSDFENQINNSLVFPGIFRAISQHRIKVITEEMKIKAAEAIAASIEGAPARNYIIPDSLDKDVAIRISNELGKIARKDKNK